MSDSTDGAATLRKAELAVIAIGVLIALTALAFTSKGAFQANLEGTQGSDKLLAFLFTIASFVLVGAIVLAPYVLVAVLGKIVAGSGKPNAYQIAGFVVSCVLTAASGYLYFEAIRVTSDPNQSSTSAIVFVIFPVLLCIVGGSLYGILIALHSSWRKRQVKE